jgi:glycosyltransferase involved in cell wall biosynthesis
MEMPSMKIAVVTCYFDPQYVRGSVIRAALSHDDSWRVVPVVNRSRGVARYPEIVLRLIWTRIRHRPDLYILTFRGQEILPVVLLVAGRRPVIFDEFIVPILYATGEAHRRSAAIVVKHLLSRLSARSYSRWLRRCALVLADTAKHASLSAGVSGVPVERYRVLPVGADETVFRPRPRSVTGTDGAVFRVVYYGNMLPLHGLPTVLAAAELLADDPSIGFLLVGGGAAAESLVARSAARGAHVEWIERVDYRDLPELIAGADLCLGGPFGGTPQAQNVVTGKTYQFLASAAPTLIGENDASGAFTDGDDTLIVRQADPLALAEKIRWAAGHREELPGIGARGRRLFEEHFSTGALAGRLNPWVHATLGR